VRPRLCPPSGVPVPTGVPPPAVSSPGRLAAAYRKTHLCDVELEGRVTMKESSFTNPGAEIVAPVSTPAGKVRGQGLPWLGTASPPPSPDRGAGCCVLADVPSSSRQLGLAVCYDLRFPEISLALRRAGAEILTYPSAFTVPTGSAHWEVSSAPRPLSPRGWGDPGAGPPPPAASE